MRSRDVRWAVATDAVQTRLWPIPAAAVVLAIALGVVLTRVDQAVDPSLPSGLHEYLFSGGANSARSVLSTVAASLMTVTSLTFSLTVVTLQLASSQFSPRLLRTFARDRFVHTTLGLFLATFAYALTVLRTVTAGTGHGGHLLPQISITVAYLLTMASVVALVVFLAHLAREIRVETMLRRVHAEADVTLQRTLVGTDDDPPQPMKVPEGATTLTAAASGFLTSVDGDTLLAAAERAGANVWVDITPGATIVRGTPVAFAWTDSGEQVPPEAAERLQTAVDDAVHTGFERTSAQDVGHGLRQLTDVAIKALSPGINDPTTAVHALNHTAALLCAMARHPDDPELLRDDEGRPRVGLRRPRFAELLDEAVTQPRIYGQSDPAVLGALYGLLRDVAWAAPAGRYRSAVDDQLTRLRAAVDRSDLDDPARTRLARLEDAVHAAAAGRWAPEADGVTRSGSGAAARRRG